MIRILLPTLALLLLSACHSTSRPATSQQFAAGELDTYQSSRCQEQYFSASASHRSRASSAEFCDVQARNAERTRRREGRDEDLPFDPDAPR
jgi:outer membrane biogenesis lipoprotein LolB